MTETYRTHFATRPGVRKSSLKSIKPTTVAAPIKGREKRMVVNSDGAFVFGLDDWNYLDRFLILGTSEPTYYSSARKLTIDAAKNVIGLLAKDGLRVVHRVVEISQAGRAPKNDPALYVLAMAAADKNEHVRKAALEALPKVARIGTHLMHFAEYVEGFRGWGRALKRAIGDWYNEKDLDALVYQVIKYQSRDGWSNRDLLRLSHPKSDDVARNAVYRWIVGKEVEKELLPARIQGFEEIKGLDRSDIKTAIAMIREYNLPREAIPTEFLTSKEVWEVMLQNKMPLGALIRNLGKISSLGMTSGGFNETSKLIAESLTNEEALRKARVHPIAILSALRIYEQGHGEKGSLRWSPDSKIISALDDAFYASFRYVRPSGKNVLLALDISGSMGAGQIAGVPGLTPRDATAAMSMVTLATEPNTMIWGFSHQLIELNIRKGMKLNEAVRAISGLPFGYTNPGLVCEKVARENVPADGIVIYTDNEVNSGRHPTQVLERARQVTGRPIRQVVVGMTVTGFSIADPKDPLQMDCVGFDSSAPSIISDFISDGVREEQEVELED